MLAGADRDSPWPCAELGVRVIGARKQGDPASALGLLGGAGRGPVAWEGWGKCGGVASLMGLTLWPPAALPMTHGCASRLR